MNIKEEVLNLTRLHTSIVNLSKRHSDKMKSLVERMQNGESSGDPVFDFCTACYGQLGFEEEVRAPYAELANKLKGRKGQEILWTYSMVAPTGREVYHSVETETTMDLKMGILNSDEGLEFSLEDKSLVFSAEPHLESQHTFVNICNLTLLGGLEWKFAQGRLIVPYTQLTHLAEPVIKRMPYSGHGPYGKSQILVGDEVKKFFEEASSVGKCEVYQKAINLLTPEREVPQGI